MSRCKKNRPMRLLALLLPMFVLAVLPGAVVAQNCPSDNYPPQLGVNVQDLSTNLTLLETNTFRALSRFADILGRDSVSPEVGYGEFFERLLVENVYVQFKSFPGFSVVKNTLLGVVKFDAENRKAFVSRKARSVADWVERENINLANVNEYNVVTKLKCAYAKAYLNLPAAMQDEFVIAVGDYAEMLGESVTSQQQILIELIEEWMNSNFDGKEDGFIIARVIFNHNSSGIETKSLKISTPAYSQQIGSGLNLSLKDRGMKPFELNVYKLILFHDEAYFDDRGIGEKYLDTVKELNSKTPSGPTLCSKQEQCVAAAFLNKNNKVVFGPFLDEAKGKLRSLQMQKFVAFEEFTN